jgi:branched-chain amino acid transport system ATP-binding protein
MVNGRITISGTGKDLLEREDIKAAYLEGSAQKTALQGGP